MKNAKKVNVVESSKQVTTKKENKNIDNATIKALTKNEERKTSVKEKNFLYKFQLESTKLTDKQSKQQRNKLRRNLKLIVNKIILANLKKKDLTLCKEFIIFYKANYILNDFTLKSLTNVNDKDLINDYTIVLNLCKESLSK